MFLTSSFIDQAFALTLKQNADPLLMSTIEQLLRLGRDRFFNSDCEKADGKTS